MPFGSFLDFAWEPNRAKARYDAFQNGRTFNFVSACCFDSKPIVHTFSCAMASVLSPWPKCQQFRSLLLPISPEIQSPILEKSGPRNPCSLVGLVQQVIRIGEEHYGPKSRCKSCIQIEKRPTIQVEEFQPQDRRPKGFGKDRRQER